MEDIEALLTRCLAEVMAVDAAAIPPDATLAELGVDSLLRVRFAGIAGERLGREFEPEWLYDYPSISAMAALLRQPRDLQATTAQTDLPS